MTGTTFAMLLVTLLLGLLLGAGFGVLWSRGRDGAELARRGRDLPVRWHGFVSDVPAFLGELDLFCLPSRREAMPLALLEAMAAGLPCIATDVGAVRASVGDAAVVVPPADPAALAAALAELLADPDRRQELGRRARAHAVEHFDADVMARRTYEVLALAVLAAAA
jgi:glycosyltransferase involved in cell wall biosynthesis